VRVCTPDLGCTGGNNDIAAGTNTDFVGACTPTLTFRYSAARQLNGMKCEFGAFVVQWKRVSDKTVTEVFMYDVINKKGFSLAIGHLEESRDLHKAAAGNYHGQQAIFTVHASKKNEFSVNNA
jgi:hypothetical protein